LRQELAAQQRKLAIVRTTDLPKVVASLSAAGIAVSELK
jgi:hypothetical protein